MSSTQDRRLARERVTIGRMISIYCRGRHSRATDGGPRVAVSGLCVECEELFSYARKRIEKCPYEEEKPPCADCPIHCYHPARREQVKAVMRYAAPRMTLRHPWLALMHILDGFRKIPEVPKKIAGRPSAQGGRGGASAG